MNNVKGSIILGLVILIGIPALLLYFVFSNSSNSTSSNKSVITKTEITITPVPTVKTVTLYADDGRKIENVPEDQIKVYGSGWYTQSYEQRRANEEEQIKRQESLKEQETRKSLETMWGKTEVDECYKMLEEYR